MKWIVCFLALAVFAAGAFSQRFTTLGRNPMVPGGISWEQAKAMGMTPYRLPDNTHLKMRGASGEWVDAFLPKGTAMARRQDGTEVILACGNVTNRVWVVQTKTKIVESPPLVIYRDREVPGPERIVEKKIRVPFDRYVPVLLMAPQQQYIANLSSPTVISPTIGGIGVSVGGGNRINVNAYGAAAAAAAAAASSSAASTAVTPTSAAGAGGGNGSGAGSSGAAGGRGS